jgi:glycosyltransferase involved in cell wall biosynthesis
MEIEDEQGSGAGDRPLVTIAVFAYNQEQYVGAAVKAALAQTYSPLEVLLSDDCSPDGTFEVMRKCAETYSGPHRVTLNRNEPNLGLSGHINRLAELARGSIIVLAAGDDISLPNRAERIAAEFIRSAEVRAAFSGYTEMDLSAKDVRDVPLSKNVVYFASLDSLAKTGGGVGLGATFAYHRDCFTTHGPIPSNILCEDGILPFRAALLGKVAVIPEPLVRYRVHQGSATAGARFMSPEYQAAHYAVIDAELDSSFAAGLIDVRLYKRTKKRLARWPAFIDRCRRLSRRPMLARMHYAWYFSDVWVQRLLARFERSESAATRA